MRCELTPPRFFRPPAPVKVKKAGRRAFVQTPPLGYDRGKSLMRENPLLFSVVGQCERVLMGF